MKNRFECEGDTCKIFLRRKAEPDLVCYIDTNDLPLVQSVPLWWHVRSASSGTQQYVEHDQLVAGKRSRIQLSNVILGVAGRIQRKDGNGLNNRRSNLQVGESPCCGKCGRERQISSGGKRFCGHCNIANEQKRRADPRYRAYFSARDRRCDLARRAKDPFCRYRQLPVARADLKALFAAQSGRCALTQRQLDPCNMHLDHILPLARGGKTELSNLRFLAPEVNMAKRHLLDSEFLSLCSDVIAHHGIRLENFAAALSA